MSNAYWVSIAPWLPSGYGQQTMLQTQQIAQDHNVRIGAISGLQGSPQPWQPPGGELIEVWQVRDSLDFIEQYVHFRADFAIALFDLWAEGDEAPDLFKYINQAPVRLACWMPVDCEPLSKPDLFKLRGLGDCVTPIAMSRHGMRMLRNEGFKPLYVPHSIDTELFKPMDDLKEARLKLGLDPDEFIIGINAFNSIRKAWGEQLSAFALFHSRHPNSRLLIHSVEQRSADDGVNLLFLIDELGLRDCVGFTDQFSYRQSLIGPQFLVKWYNALSVLSLASIGEGFGIPLIEAQACGVPVITTRTAAQVELAPHGWLIDGQSYWNAYLSAWHRIPNVARIDEAYEEAYQEWRSAETDRGVTQWRARQQGVRLFAQRYDIRNIYDKFWKPALAQLGAK